MSDVPEGYKMSEVGVIPGDWEVETIGDIFTFGGGYSASRDQLSSDGHCYLHYGDIHKSTKSFIDVQAEYPDIPKLNIPLKRISPKSLLHNGDVVFVDASEDDEGTSKHIVVVNNEDITYISGLHTIVAKSKVEILDNGYKRYCFQSRDIKRQFYFYAVGTKVSGISKTNIAKLQLPIPPLPEQQAIASALSDVDALIAALEQLITKKRNIKQGAMQRLLTGEKRLPGFGGVWEVINIAENSVLKARIGWQGLTTAEYLKNGEYYLVTGTDFIEGKINWSGCHFIDENRYIQDKNIQLRNDDVLITKDGTIGKVGYVDNLPGKATLNSGVFVIRPRDKSYFPLFFYYVLKSNIFDTFMKQLRAGSTIAHLYQKDFVDFSFSVPSPPEQQAIAQILSDMDAEIEVLEQKRNKYKAIKQGMMQELLTGKTRLV